MSRIADLNGLFEDRFGVQAGAIVRGPGRVNLIGEHTDYNDGFVLPMAIDRDVLIALRAREDRIVRMVAADLGDEQTFDLDDLQKAEGWQEYVKGVAWALMDEFAPALRGFDAVMAGNVPRGAGLSSSAALELATARAFQVSSSFPWDPVAMALAGKHAENAWVGVNSGIMDQLISALGTEGHALLIDCRSLATDAVPLPSGYVVVVLDTMTRRGLVGSAYNERRAACEGAARRFGVAALRDLNLETLMQQRHALDETTLRRARHVVTENARTLAAADAMRRDDAAALGRLMDASHQSLRDDFEVSSPALDAIQAAARTAPGCVGARMTGAGFGGCAVALVAEQELEAFSAAVAARYRREQGRDPQLYVCLAVQGANRVV